MKVAVFSTKPYDKPALIACNDCLDRPHELKWIGCQLSESTAVLATGCEAVCVFVNDHMGADVLNILSDLGIRHAVLRCAGFDRVDLEAARSLGLTVARVPAYSPHSVAEHAITLLLAVDRKIPKAYIRCREHNFELDGLMARELHGRTLGIVGTGKIGQLVAQIAHGFGMTIIGFDVYQNDEFKRFGSYKALDEVLADADFVSLHVPLLESTKNMINAASLAKMKQGAVLINTSRGGLVNTYDVVQALKKKTLGGLGIDVYDQEHNIGYFEDTKNEIMQDDVFGRLMSFPNVVVTAHQAWFSEPALYEIAATTMHNLQRAALGEENPNSVL